MVRAIFISALLLLLTAGAVWCANVKEELQGVNRQIDEKKQLLNRTTKVEEKVSGELAQIEKSLKEKESSLQAMQRDLHGVDVGLAGIRKDMELARTDTERKKLDIQRRLLALYKAGDMGNARMAFSAESFPQMLENLRYMRGVVESDRKMIAAYNNRIRQLKGLEDIQQRDVQRKERIKASIEEKTGEIEAEKRKKAGYLAQLRKDKKGYQASLHELEANARRLQEMVERLEALSRKSYTEKNAKPAGKGGTASLAPLPNKGFNLQKGRLALPVQGTILAGFGKHKHQEFNSYTFSNGISIAAAAGTDIHAVFDGRVIFAEYFKGYGNMIILDHGGGYFSVYAHAAKLFKGTGVKVARNDVLAKVGELDSSRGPMLYFEIRHQGKPVDPAPWFR